VSSGLALVLKRDAKNNPFFYLIGVVMDFLSLVFIALAIGLFRSGVFPGRSDVQPPYCNLWTETVGTECSIRLGAGFYFYCAVLILTATNFIGEFCIAERDQTYGARKAWSTVFRRVRQGRFKSVYKPTSTSAVSSPGGDTADQAVSFDNNFGEDLPLPPDGGNGIMSEPE